MRCQTDIVTLFYSHGAIFRYYDCCLGTGICKMIHAEHFAAAVNNRTEKQDSNCLAIVIVMNVFLYNSVDQFHATNEIHHGETFQFECLEQKQNMLFNPTS